MLTNSVLQLTLKLGTALATAGVVMVLASNPAQADTTTAPTPAPTASTAASTVRRSVTSNQDRVSERQARVAKNTIRQASFTPATFTIGTTQPTAANTGPAADGITSFTASGDVSTTTPGQTITGLDISGFVNVNHNNTTVRGNLIHGRNAGKYIQNSLVRVAPGVTGTVIEFNEIYQYATIGYWQNGVGGSDYTARRNNLHDVVDMFDIDNGKATIEANYMTAFSFQSNDADQARDTYHPYWSHNDGVQIKGGAKNTIRGNNIQMYASKKTGTLDAPTAYNYGSGITASPGKSAVTDLLVTANWLAGGEVGFQANFYYTGTQGGNLGEISDNRVSHDQHYYPIRYKTGYTVTGTTTNTWDTNSPTVPANMKGTALTTTTGGGIHIDS